MGILIMKVVLIGLGSIGKKHVDALLTLNQTFSLFPILLIVILKRFNPY